MLQSLISSALTTLLTAIIFALMARGNNVPVRTNHEGKKTLRVQKFLLYFSFVCLALCVVCCLAPLLINPEEGLAVLIAPSLMALFLFHIYNLRKDAQLSLLKNHFSPFT